MAMSTETPAGSSQSVQSKIQGEVRSRTAGYLVGAFGVVAGLAWNEAVRALIDWLFPLSANSLWAKFLYAVLVTIVVVLISMYLLRFTSNERRDR